MAFENKPATPVVQKSDEDIAELAPKALSYLKRTDNLDVAEILGLSSYLEESDEQQNSGGASCRDELDDRGGLADGCDEDDQRAG